MYSRVGWIGLGALIGAVAVGGVAVIIVQIIIPWDAICATVAPAQRVVETGGALIAELRAWLDAAEAALSAGGSPDQTATAREGLGGLLDRARDTAATTTGAAVDVMIAPIRALVSLAVSVLGAIEETVESARASLEAIDQTQC